MSALAIEAPAQYRAGAFALLGTLLAELGNVYATSDDHWKDERERLLKHRISELGLTIEGTAVERLATRLYDELRERGLAFFPPVYLSDQWGCPDGIPIIGVPFYLADPRLARIEEEEAMSVETEDEMMRYLRHEAGHAYNYAFRLHDDADWHRLFGPYSRPYRDRFRVDPLSRAHVRHILGWYAQKHPDEDFAETFAVWLTPDLNWREAYKGWAALKKLKYVDKVMRTLHGAETTVPLPSEDDLPVHAMHYTVEEHYGDEERLGITDERHFDGDLRSLFAASPAEGERAGEFLRRHHREIVGRVSYWTGEGVMPVRTLVDLLANRSDALELVVRGREASTLIEVTAFATAVMMNVRYSGAI